MASLREAARNVLNEASEGIAWILVYKRGRSWTTESLYLDYNDRTHRFTLEKDQIDYFKSVLGDDNGAVLCNGYYDNLGDLENMTLASLMDGIQYQYNNRHNLVLDVI